jgi:hypothetical protein
MVGEEEEREVDRRHHPQQQQQQQQHGHHPDVSTRDGDDADDADDSDQPSTYSRGGHHNQDQGRVNYKPRNHDSTYEETADASDGRHQGQYSTGREDKDRQYREGQYSTGRGDKEGQYSTGRGDKERQYSTGRGDKERQYSAGVEDRDLSPPAFGMYPRMEEPGPYYQQPGLHTTCLQVIKATQDTQGQAT